MNNIHGAAVRPYREASSTRELPNCSIMSSLKRKADTAVIFSIHSLQGRCSYMSFDA